MLNLNINPKRHRRSRALGLGMLTAAGIAAVSLTTSALAKDNDPNLTPKMGWSSWSFVRRNPTEAIIKNQALAMHKNLQSHGFVYVNLDDFWYLDPRQTVDEYGRWVADPSIFPGGMAALATYIHRLGLKFGMYVTPGIPVAAYKQNTKIEGTKYHAQDIADATQYEINYNFGNANYYIDYRKPGAQEFIASWARLFASWGVDYIKIDGVGTWDVPDIIAWSKALVTTGRPIHLALSNDLSVSAGATWSAYSNSWRITGDVEAYLGPIYPLTRWDNVLYHFQQTSLWTRYSRPSSWPDPDSLEIGNGPLDGTNHGTNPADFFTENQRPSVMSYWAMAAAPLILGTDLTGNLDPFDYTLLHNDEVLALDQAGVQGTPVFDYADSDPHGTMPELWRSKQPDNSFAVLLSNPAANAQTGTLNWSTFGVAGPVIVRDLWSGTNLVANPNTNGGYAFSSPFTYNLAAYQSKLLKLTPLIPVRQYLIRSVDTSINASAKFFRTNTATDGVGVGYVSNGGTVTFGKVKAAKAGNYAVSIVYFNGDSSARSGRLTVTNGSTSAVIDLMFPATGSSWSPPAIGAITKTVPLNAGDNTLTIGGNSYTGDIDSLLVQSSTTQYLADAARLNGQKVAVVPSPNGTDGKMVIGVQAGNSIAFDKITVAEAGKHSVIILYLAGMASTAAVKANSDKPVQVQLPSTSGNASNSTVVGAVSVDLNLRAGVNRLTISNGIIGAPNFDSIIVAQ